MGLISSCIVGPLTSEHGDPPCLHPTAARTSGYPLLFLVRRAENQIPHAGALGPLALTLQLHLPRGTQAAAHGVRASRHSDVFGQTLEANRLHVLAGFGVAARLVDFGGGLTLRFPDATQRGERFVP